MCGLFMRGGIGAGLVQNELRKIVRCLQRIEAVIARCALAPRAGSGDGEVVDMRGFYMDMNPCDVHRVGSCAAGVGLGFLGYRAIIP